MAKLGDFEFPEVGLNDSIDLARRIHENMGGEVRRDGLAMILDMAPTGGAYAAKIGALRIWGLATGRSVIKLTADATKIASATDSLQELSTLAKLAKSVLLFNELQERLGNADAEPRILAVMLQEITGAEMDEIMRRVAMIQRIFDGIRTFYSIENPQAWIAQQTDPTSNPRSKTAEIASQELPEGWIEFRYDDGNLRLRETNENLDVMIGVLEARKRRFDAIQTGEAHAD